MHSNEVVFLKSAREKSRAGFVFIDAVANKSVSAQIECKCERAPYTQNITGKGIKKYSVF